MARTSGTLPVVGLLAAGLVLILTPVLVFLVVVHPGHDCDPASARTGVPGPPGTGVRLPGNQELGLSPTQLGNAAAIITEGHRLGVPRRGVVVALAVANQESEFYNYANDGQGSDLTVLQLSIASSLRLPHDQVGTDHGSLGVFQQQWPWWGTMRQLMTPTTAARTFYQALRRVPGWESMPVTVAGQAVQRSAYPDAYADDVDLATTLLDEQAQPGAPGSARGGVVDAFDNPTQDDHLIDNVAGGVAGGVGCADFTLCPATGLPVEHGLTPDALLVVRCVVAEFALTDLGGVDGRPDNPDSLHPSGRAVDVMIPGWDTPTGVALGDRVATWARTYAARMGITQVIWRGAIWTTARTTEGWRPYTHPTGATDPTRTHVTHVHISVAGNAAVQPSSPSPPAPSPTPSPARRTPTWPTGATAAAAGPGGTPAPTCPPRAAPRCWPRTAAGSRSTPRPGGPAGGWSRCPPAPAG